MTAASTSSDFVISKPASRSPHGVGAWFAAALCRPRAGILLLTLMAVGLTSWTSSSHAQGLRDLFMSPDKEKEIGAEQHDKIVAEFGGVYDDEEIGRYVDSIGQFLAQASNAPQVGYTFTVLDSPVVNAFALPGGYVYVTRGLMALADTEAELAGVIAHEIGHVAARHGADRYSNSMLTGIGLAILGIATNSSALTNIASVGAQALLTSYSREDEFEADQLGVSYLTRAGFEPEAMSSFLRKMEANSQLQSTIRGGGGGAPGFDFFSSHPRTADRVDRAVNLASSVRVSRPIVGRDVFLGKINGLIYGDDPKQGLIEGRRFVHPEIGFELTVPEGFVLDNQPTQVIAKNQNGAVIKLDGDARKRGSMVNYLRSVWPDTGRAPKFEALRINGMEGAMAASRVSADRGPVDLRVIALAFDRKRVFRLTFITAANQTRDLNVDFRRTTYSFKRLPKDARDDVQPFVISVQKVGRNDDLDSMAERMELADFAREQFMVLNDFGEGAHLQAGRRVKVITRRARP